MENKKTNWGLVIGVVIATVAVLAAGAYIAMKLLKKKDCDCDCCCCEEELDDADICVLEDDDDIDDLELVDVE